MDRFLTIIDRLLAAEAANELTKLNEDMGLYEDTAVLEHTDIVIRCHHPSQCEGQICSLHNRTDHSMRSFPQHWRSDRGIMERTCPHMVSHPDPDEYRILNGDDDGTHGCDGCCVDVTLLTNTPT